MEEGIVTLRRMKAALRFGMNAKPTVEVFSAGCPACQEAIELVNRVARSLCDVSGLDIE